MPDPVVPEPVVPEPVVPEPVVPVPIVTVRGSAQLDGPPDLATLTFTAHRAGKSADVVRAGLAEASGQVRELLRGLDAAIERSSTSGLHVAPVFGRRPETDTKIHGYRGSFSTEIVVRDFDALSPLVLALAPVAGGQVDGPWWSLRPDNPMFRDVRLAAIADARRRADDYAAAFSCKVADLLEVSDLDGGFVGGREIRAMAAFDMAGQPNQPELAFEPGIQTVSGQVTVRFTLTLPRLPQARVSAR